MAKLVSKKSCDTRHVIKNSSTPALLSWAAHIVAHSGIPNLLVFHYTRRSALIEAIRYANLRSDTFNKIALDTYLLHLLANSNPFSFWFAARPPANRCLGYTPIETIPMLSNAKTQIFNPMLEKNR